VVYDGPSAALTPALLRELYGVQADEILAGASPLAAAPAAPTAQPANGWMPPQLAQVA